MVCFLSGGCLAEDLAPMAEGRNDIADWALMRHGEMVQWDVMNDIMCHSVLSNGLDKTLGAVDALPYATTNLVLRRELARFANSYLGMKHVYVKMTYISGKDVNALVARDELRSLASRAETGGVQVIDQAVRDGLIVDGKKVQLTHCSEIVIAEGFFSPALYPEGQINDNLTELLLSDTSSLCRVVIDKGTPWESDSEGVSGSDRTQTFLFYYLGRYFPSSARIHAAGNGCALSLPLDPEEAHQSARQADK